MKFKIEIDIENAAFEDSGEGREVSEILYGIINKIQPIDEFEIGEKGRTRDMNGNTVGFWEITE